MMAAIYDSLHHAALTVTGFDSVLSRFDFKDIFLDPDGITYHGVQRFKILIGGS